MLTPSGVNINDRHLWITDLEGNYIQRDVWPRLVQPGMTILIRRNAEGDMADEGGRVQHGFVYVINSDGDQYAFAHQSCRNWQVC